MKHAIHSHQRGSSKLPANLQKEISGAIHDVRVPIAKGMSTPIRKAISDNLRNIGWSDELIVAPGSKMTITSKKNSIGLCAQTGNMGRVYADLMKLQTLYHDNVIKAAAIVLPSKTAARTLGDNLADADRLMKELDIFAKVYDVPTVIFSLEE